MFKEKKGKYDIISYHYITTSAFRYPTCKYLNLAFVANGLVYAIFIKMNVIKKHMIQNEKVSI